MTGSAHSDVARTSPTASPPVAAAGNSPRARGIKSAKSTIGLLEKWRSMFRDDLRTVPVCSAHILMSAATVFLGEISSVLSQKPTDNADESQETAKDKMEAERGSGMYPAEGDFEGRQSFGQRELREGVYPLLRAMGNCRSASQLLLKRLERAERERFNLVKQYLNGQSVQEEPSVKEPHSQLKEDSQHQPKDGNIAEVSSRSLTLSPGSISTFLSNMPDFAWEIPGLPNRTLTSFDDPPPSLWSSTYAGDSTHTPYLDAEDMNFDTDDF